MYDGRMTEILFLCNTNRGKSQMAAALAAQAAPHWTINSAGVQPEKCAGEVNQEAVASLAKVGADMSGGWPKPIDATLVARADHIVIVGGAAFAEGEHVERWDIVDPSLRGLEGEERMDALRDDIGKRVLDLVQRLEAKEEN